LSKVKESHTIMSENGTDSDNYKSHVENNAHPQAQEALAENGEENLLGFEKLSKTSSKLTSECFESGDLACFYDTRETHVRTKSTTNEYIIELACPGLNLGEIHIELSRNGILHIEGELKPSDEYKNGNKLLQSERKFGKFWRSVKLPKDASQMIQTNPSEHGIICITIQRIKFGDKVF